MGDSTSDSTRSWPAPRAVCLDCRTLLGAGEACDAGRKHRVAPMPERRAAVVDEVWGPPSVRRRARQAAKAGAAGGSAGGLFEGCTAGCEGCGELGALEGEAAAIFFAIVVAAIAVVILYFVIKQIIEWYRRRKNRPRANGALRKPARLGPSTGMAGTIVAVDTLEPPIAGARGAVAFGVALLSGRQVILRHGAAIQFDIELDEGLRARVPAGRAMIDLSGVASQSADADAARDLLATIDPAPPAGEEYPPFPFDRIKLRAVAPGDRVELMGVWELAPDPDAHHAGGYRDAAPSILVPRGVARLRLSDL